MTRLRRWWCRLAHRKLMLPIHGRYLCSVCMQQFESYK